MCVFLRAVPSGFFCFCFWFEGVSMGSWLSWGSVCWPIWPGIPRAAPPSTSIVMMELKTCIPAIKHLDPHIPSVCKKDPGISNHGLHFFLDLSTNIHLHALPPRPPWDRPNHFTDLTQTKKPWCAAPMSAACLYERDGHLLGCYPVGANWIAQEGPAAELCPCLLLCAAVSQTAVAGDGPEKTSSFLGSFTATQVRSTAPCWDGWKWLGSDPRENPRSCLPFV